MLASAEDSEGLYSSALNIAAALLSGHIPDGCEVCRRVLEGIHPDVTVIDYEKGEIPIGAVRSIIHEAYILPLEAPRKVFIIRHCQNMNAAAQNAALKILEEPPERVCFLLLCENTAAMLQTVMSRCMLIRDDGSSNNEKQFDEETISLASSFIHALGTGEELELYKFCLSCEKLKRAQLAVFLEAVLDKLRTALLTACGAGQLCETDEDVFSLASVSVKNLVKITEIIRDRMQRNDGNVGAAHLLGTIPAEYFAVK